MNEPYLALGLRYLAMTMLGKKTVSKVVSLVTIQDATDVSVDCLDETLRSRLVNHDVYIINLYLAL